MPENQETAVPPGEFLRVLLHHRKKGLAVFFIIFGICLVWIVFKSKSYESVAKLYVRMGRENVTLDPTATTGKTVEIRPSHEIEINSILEILNSHQVATLVVQDLGAETILRPKFDATSVDSDSDDGQGPTPRSTWSILFSGINEFISQPVNETDQNRAITKILAGTSISALKQSSVVTLQCRASHPKLAQQIASSWTNAFFQEHLRMTRTEGSYEFFEKQVKMIAKQLADAERELKDIKSTSELVSVEGQQNILVSAIDMIRSKTLLNKSLLASSEAKLQVLQKQVEVLAPQATTKQMTSVSDDSWDRMRERLYELQIQEQELKTRAFANHPDVIAVEKQRKEVEAILKSQPNTRLLQQSILDELVLIASLRSEKEVLQQARLQSERELRKLNDDTMIIVALERQIEILGSNCRTHVDKMEEARIHQSLDDERISSVNTMQPASLSERPIGLSNSKCLLLGVIVAFIGGVGFVLLAEFFSNSFVTPTQVEQTLGLPVLVSIPKTMSPRVRAR